MKDDSQNIWQTSLWQTSQGVGDKAETMLAALLAVIASLASVLLPATPALQPIPIKTEEQLRREQAERQRQAFKNRPH